MNRQNARPGKNRDDLPFPTAFIDNGGIVELFSSDPPFFNVNKSVFKEKIFFEQVYFEAGYWPGYKVRETFEGTILDGLKYINDHFWEDE